MAGSVEASGPASFGLPRILAAFLLACCVAACGSHAARSNARPPAGTGIYHEVARGENLFRIGKAYGFDYRELARVNDIDDPAKIEIGQKIFIPGATRRLPVEIIAPVATSESRPEPQEMPVGDGKFVWPIRTGALSSRFGPRGSSFHDGVDVAAPEGTPVYAARGGRVIYSDQIPGYGNIVIVDHGDGLSSVYAHNSANEVRQGDTVRQGDLVSRVGRTGRTTGPNLHFEIRSRNIARNPLFYLPEWTGPVEAS